VSGAARRDINTLANMRVAGRGGPYRSPASPACRWKAGRPRSTLRPAPLRHRQCGPGRHAAGLRFGAANALPAVKAMPSNVRLIQTGDAETSAELASGFGGAFLALLAVHRELDHNLVAHYAFAWRYSARERRCHQCGLSGGHRRHAQRCGHRLRRAIIAVQPRAHVADRTAPKRAGHHFVSRLGGCRKCCQQAGTEHNKQTLHSVTSMLLSANLSLLQKESARLPCTLIR
jgi:hypothetical protein